MPDKIACQMTTWDDIESWCKSIKTQMEKDGWIPDVIVGLARGGWTPARILSDLLIIKELYSIKTEHWGLTATKDGKAKLVQGLDADISGKKVLVLDDIADTGESLKLGIDHVKEVGGPTAEIRSATLLHLPHSTTRADYIAKEFPPGSWFWFIFPWNYHEDITNLLPKVFDGKHTLEQVCSNCAEFLDLDMPEAQVKEALESCIALDKVAIEGEMYSLMR